jgi:hypothetical protein
LSSLHTSRQADDLSSYSKGPPVLKLKNNSLNQTSFTVLRPNQPASRGRVVDETHPGTYVVMMGNFISITIVFRGTYPIDVDIVSIIMVARDTFI